jgi:hypothetical protein
LKIFCKLCNKKVVLCNSHAIPDSVFRSIFSTNSGKAILLSNSVDEPISYSKDSWATDQLCADCEQKINHRYEEYSLKALRGQFEFKRLEGGVLFQSVDALRIKHFVAAILWRASISEHESYNAVKLPNKLNERIRLSLNTNNYLSKRSLSIRGFKLIDSTNGGFSKSALRDFIVSPFVREYRGNQEKIGKTVCFIFLGYLFEIFVFGRPTNNSYNAEFIGYNKSSYHFKYQEINEAPEIQQLFAESYRKHVEGNSKLKC